MRFLVLGVLLTTLSSVQQHVGAVSASDSIILSALEEAIDTMRANSETGSSSSVKKVGQRGSSKHECSSLDGPFCPLVNSEMYSLGGSPFSSGEESERLYETQVRKSLNKVLAALKDKPSTSEAADDVEINSDDATNVDENDDAALSRQGNRELEDLVTSAGIDDLADTYRSMELNEIIREARALISDEDGNVRKLNNPEEVEAFINDILDEEGEGDTDSLSPSSDLGGEDVNGRVSSGMEAPREEEILQLSTMKNVRVSQSSVFLNREAKLAIDGNTDGDWPSISHTYNQKEAWWQVSLPSAYPVSSIRIWNRRDGGSAVRQRLFPFFLLLSDDSPFNDKTCPNPSVCNSLKDAKRVALDYMHFASSESCRVEEGKADGREMCLWELETPVPVKHVRIQLVDSNHLNLAEVELLISKDFADALDSPLEADEEMMEIMSNGEQIGINHDMNGPAGDDGDL